MSHKTKSRKGAGYVCYLPGRDGGSGMLEFKPTLEVPALQYFETVSPGSAAERAGLQLGDYLLEVRFSYFPVFKSLNI